MFGVLAFLGAAASAPWRHPPQWWEFDALLVSLRRGIEQDAPADQLVNQAIEIHGRLARFPDREAEAHFLIGSAFYRQARQKPAVFAREVWPRAAEHLEKAHEQGLGDLDRFPLKYRLGYSLYQQKKDLPRAVELMMVAVDKGAEQPLDAYRLLVEANLGLKTPNVDAAMSASQRILDLTPEREIEAMAAARLQHGELLLRKHARAEAFKELERIGPKASFGVRIKARLLQTRACEEDGKWQEAIQIWQQLLKEAPHVEGGKARVLYSMGWCYHQMEPPNHTETIRVWTESLKLGGPEGQAAGLRLGELRLSMGAKHAKAALADWTQALAKVNSPKDFQNSYIQLAEVAELFKHAIQQFNELQDPEKTQQVADLYQKIAPGGVAQQHRAKAAEELAEQMLDKHKSNIGKISLDDVKAQFRRAAGAYELAAKAMPDDKRSEALWRSVQCYLSARENESAIKILMEHLKWEKNETRLAEAWYTLGDLYRLQGTKKLAHDAFVKCIEIPDTAFTSRSRYFLALEEIDNKEFDKACEILQQNLRDGAPSFDRPSHERSLYKLAWLVQQMKRYDQALIYLKECQRLYPENPNVMLAREQLGECYRQLAKKELASERDVIELLKEANLSDERRQTLMENARAHKLTRVSWLTDAGKTYQELCDDLEKQAKEKPLNQREQELLRRALFGIGECHLDNDEYGHGIDKFMTVQAKHRRSLESLFATSRICNLIDVMIVRQVPKMQVDDARAKALESLRLLAEDVKAMPEKHDAFQQREVPTREQWLSWHDAMQMRLLAPAPKAKGSTLFP